MYFIRFNFPKNTSLKTKVKATTQPVLKSTKFKPKKIMIVAGQEYNDSGATGNGPNERDFICKNITPKIADNLRLFGHTVALYGGSTQSQYMYQDTVYGHRLGDGKKYGMYWVKIQGYDSVLEIHLDAANGNASGGHTIISTAFKTMVLIMVFKVQSRVQSVK